MNKNQKNQKPAPDWHHEAIHLIQDNFGAINSALLDSTRRAVWFGALLAAVKLRGKEDGSIPHGRFIPWLKKNTPDLPERTAREWMTAARRAFELSKRQFLPFCQDYKLPSEVESVIAGKTKYALFLEWKQAQSDDDDGLIPAIGRAKGEGGRPAAPEGPIEEVVAARCKAALRIAGKADQMIEKLGVDWLAFNDDQINALISSFERPVKCMRAWLNTPPAKRNMNEIAALWKSL